LQTLFQRPGDDVAQRVKIKMQVERDTVVQSNAFVVNLVVADEAKAECHDPAQLAPDEKARSFRHPLPDCAKIILRQSLEFQWRTLVDREIQRINLINKSRDIIDDLHLDLGRLSSFAELSA